MGLGSIIMVLTFDNIIVYVCRNTFSDEAKLLKNIFEITFVVRSIFESVFNMYTYKKKIKIT